MLVNDIEILIQNTYSSGQLFLLNTSTENCLRLDEGLTVGLIIYFFKRLNINNLVFLFTKLLN